MEHDYDEHLASNFYHDRHFDSDAAKILPGEYYVTGKQMVLVTVLGSCVAACIRDTDSGIGGMNHFMLPDDGRRDTASHPPPAIGREIGVKCRASPHLGYADAAHPG